MSSIDTKNAIIENESLLISDERVDDIDFSSVKFEWIEKKKETTVEKVMEIDIEGNEEPIRYNDLAAMWYTLEKYRKDHPLEKRNHDILKRIAGNLFKENISRYKYISENVDLDLFTKEDFEGIFLVSLNVNAVKLNTWDIKATLTNCIRKLMNSGILALGNVAVSPENIVESILNNKPICTDTLWITVVDSEKVWDIRYNILCALKNVLRDTFNQLQHNWCQVLDWEQDFKKVFWKV